MKKLLSALLCAAIVLSSFCWLPATASAVTRDQTVIIGQQNAYVLIDILNTQVVDLNYRYEIEEDITIKASDLHYEHLASGHTNAYFIGDIDGWNAEENRNNVITIEVDTDMSRPLLLGVGSLHEMDRESYITNLDIHFTGNVNTAPISSNPCYYTHFENVNVIVDGDVVANPHYLGSASGSNGMAVGFTYALEMGGSVKNCSTTVAGNIGTHETLSGYTFDAGDNPVTVECNSYMAAGFALRLHQARTVTGNSVDAGSIVVASAGKFASVSGFVDYAGYCTSFDDNHVTVDGDIGVDSVDANWYRLVSYVGAYGFGRNLHLLTNSSVTVGGDLYMRNQCAADAGTGICDNADCYALAIGLCGTLFFSPSDGFSSSYPQYIADNTVNIGGDLEAAGNNNIVVCGGIHGQVSISPRMFVESENNAVTIGGSMIAKDIGLSEHPNSDLQGVVLAGFALNDEGLLRGGVGSSLNDSLVVEGDVVIDSNNLNSSAFLFGAWIEDVQDASVTINGDVLLASESGNIDAAYMFGADLEEDELNQKTVTLAGSELLVNGSVSALSESGDITVSGFGRNIQEITGCNSSVFGDITLNAKNGNAAYAGFYFGQDTLGEYLIGEIPLVENRHNGVFVGGDVAVTAGGTGNSAYAAGYALDALDSATVENISVRIDGDLAATGSADAIAVGGFAEAGNTSEISDSMIFVKGAVNAKAANNATAAGFIGDVGSATLQNNAVFVIDGVSAAAAARNSGNFAATAQNGAKITNNTLLGKPGQTGAADTTTVFGGFIGDVASGANVANNYFTSVLHNQRVSNLLTYQNGAFTILDSSAQDRYIASGSGTNSYALSSDTAAGTLSVYGKDAGHTALAVDNSVAGAADITLPTTAHPFMAMITGDDSPAVKDFVGLGEIYNPAYVSGVVFTDKNDNGIKDAGESFAQNVAVSLLCDGSQIGTGLTDAAGFYKIHLPLVSGLDPLITAQIDAGSSAKFSQKAQNNFGASGTVARKAYYATGIVLNGIIDDSPKTITNPPVITPPATGNTTPGAGSAATTTAPNTGDGGAAAWFPFVLSIIGIGVFLLLKRKEQANNNF